MRQQQEEGAMRGDERRQPEEESAVRGDDEGNNKEGSDSGEGVMRAVSRGHQQRSHQ